MRTRPKVRLLALAFAVTAAVVVPAATASASTLHPVKVPPAPLKWAGKNPVRH